MAKKQKIKKQKNSSAVVVPITSLCNISGLQHETDPFANDTSLNELDDCLAMMDQSLQANVTSFENTPGNKPASSLSRSVAPSCTNEEPSAQKKLWKGPGIRKHASKPAPVDFTLPNIQVELARHKHMGDLSNFLLSKCKHLRMPSFERWLIDSKMEERLKRKAIKENAEIQASREQHESSSKISKGAKWERRLKRKRKELKSSLENHLTSSGLRALIDHDPCIPSMADIEDEASKQLIQEIEQGDDSMGLNAVDLCKQLCQQSCSSARHLQNLSNHFSIVSSGQYFGKAFGSRISLESNIDAISDNSSYSLVYTRKSSGDKEKTSKPFVVKINADHYDKLREMFHAVHDTTASTRPMHVVPANSLGKNPNKYSPATNIFHHLVFCISLRYASLSGAQQLLDLRGGGMQGAIHSEVFDCLVKYGRSEDVLECFASPLNAYNSRYFSMFHRDLDWHFGSVGDFFSTPSNFYRHGGVHEANPPFSPALMQQMAEKIEDHLTFADSIKCPLSFVVIVPSCSTKGTGRGLINAFAAKSFKSMLRSKFFSKHIVLNAREHGYIEGSQHLRPTRFKESQYDTSAIILQSQDAKDQDDNCLISNSFEESLRKAFASRHRAELEERRNDATDDDNELKCDTKSLHTESHLEEKKPSKMNKVKKNQKRKSENFDR